MKKIFLLFAITLFVNQCGYEKIYSDKNINVSIKEIKKEKNFINNEIATALEDILSNENSKNIFTLKIESSKEINVKSKNSKGDPSIYVQKIKVKVTATDQFDQVYVKTFLREINYNNNNDKFKLSQYQNDLEKILLQKLIEDIINYLSDLG